MKTKQITKILSVIYRAQTVLTGILFVYLSLTYLEIDSQAIFFSIQSVIAIQIIVDLGIASNSLQFMQSKMSVVKKKNIITGEKNSKEYIFTVYKKISRYFIKTSALYIIGGCIYCYYLFGGEDAFILIAAYLIIIFNAIKININYYETFIEALGDYKRVLIVKVFTGFISTLLLILSVIYIKNIYIYAIFYFANILIPIIIYLNINNKINKQIVIYVFKKLKDNNTLDKKFWGVQRNVWLNSIAGYLFYFGLTPFIYKYGNDLDARQCGLLFNIIFYSVLMGNSYLYVHNFELMQNFNIDREKYIKVSRKIIFNSIKFELLIIALSLIIFSIYTNINENYYNLNIYEIAFCSLIIIIMHVYNSIGFAIRVQKVEPIGLFFLIQAVASILLGFIGYLYGGIIIMLFIYAIICLLFLKKYNDLFRQYIK